MKPELTPEALALIRDAVAQETTPEAPHRNRLKRNLLNKIGGQARSASQTQRQHDATPRTHRAGRRVADSEDVSGAKLSLRLTRIAGALVPSAAGFAILGAGLGLALAGVLQVSGVGRPAPSPDATSVAPSIESRRGPGHRRAGATPTTENDPPPATRSALPATTSGLSPTTSAAPLPMDVVGQQESAGVPEGNQRAPVLRFADRASAESSRVGGPQRDDPSSRGPDLRAELELLKQVQAALRDGHGARAIELLEQHDVVFGAGQLWQERLAAEVFAACLIGDEKRARRASERFLAVDSTSPLATRVKSACPFQHVPTNR